MSIFSSILNKLGFGKKDEQKTSPAGSGPTDGGPQAPASSGPVAAPSQPGGGTPATQPAPTTQSSPVATPQQPKAISDVDVVAQLERLASSSAEKLNWRTSIVDLLKLLSLDSSLSSRKELAQELGCPADKMADSAQMNMWLHKTVLRRLAENGGNIPKDLL